MELQEHAHAGRRIEPAGPSRKPYAGSPVPARAALQLQSNRKLEEGEDHPDRDAQFEHINRCVKRALAAGCPVISVDTKKKELVGNYANGGQQWRVAKNPDRSKGTTSQGRRCRGPIRMASLIWGANAGFVNVGTDHDTGAFAVASIRGWWRFEGRKLYPEARTLLITADGGGSNGWRLRLWKLELQGVADESGLRLSVCHFPRAPVSGTRSSIGSFRSFRRTGGANRCEITRRS